MHIFRFQKNVMQQIYRHAIEVAPSECCGWIIENPNKTQEYFPQKNLQDQYHKLDPKQYPRTSKEAFLMNTLLLNRAIENAQETQKKLFCIVHSHIDCGAYFSEEDRKQMSNANSTDQLYPASCYLVVSVKDKKIFEQSIFYFDSQKKDFLEAKLKLE